jgi:3-hydroxymyristoyl/3-hydroxydecanoyl-(acyl carrier protein) dehydratase
MMPPQSAPELCSELHIAADHPAYAGHFPGFPLLPGALLLDEALRRIARARGIDLTEWRLASAKFLQIVRPGTALTVTHSASGTAAIRFAILSGSATVASGTLSAVAPAAAGHHGD